MSAPDPQPTSPRADSPSGRIAAMIAGELAAAGDVVVLSDVAYAVVARIVTDPALVTAYLTERLQDMVYNAVQVKVARSRQRGGQVLTVIAGGLDPNASTTPARMVKARVNWLDWMEHVRNRHVRLRSMTRPQLIEAANERFNRAHQEIERGAIMQALAERLPDDTTTVGDMFSNAAIEAIVSRIGTEKTWWIEDESDQAAAD